METPETETPEVTEIEYRKYINEKDTKILIDYIKELKILLDEPIQPNLSPQDFGYSFGIFVGNVADVKHRLDLLTQVIKKS